MFAPGGPGAASLAELGWFVVITLTVVAALMWVLVLWAAARRRGSFDAHEPPDAGGGQMMVFIGGFVVPAVILAAIFVLSLGAMHKFPLHDEHAAMHGPPEIRVVGRQWWWEVEYVGRALPEMVTTANEIHIPVGRPITIQLESNDVIHSFWIPRLHGKVDLVPGQVGHIRIQADEPGEYWGQGGEFCGAGHALMRLLVVAEPEDRYQLWLARQRAPAVMPIDDAGIRGEKLFTTAACGLCHTVRGTAALGRIGPDLTHLATRRAIASNTLPNLHSYLSAWAVRAQSFKPGARMPNLTAFTGAELDSLTRYLLELR